MSTVPTSTVANSRLIHLTDRNGTPLLPPTDCLEPNPGSIIMTDGLWGTAWQLHFSDMRWHPTRGGGSKTWDDLLARRNVVLVYDAEPRPEMKGGGC